MDWSRIFNFRELDDEPKPFLDHVEDLRKTVIKVIAVLLVMMVGAFAFQNTIVQVILRPLSGIDPERKSLVNFGVADPLSISLELSFYAGLIMAFPFIVFFLAEFILPALTKAERRLLYPAAGFSFGLFLVGVAFAYFFVLPPTLDYFFNYSRSLGWQPQWSVREYFSFTTQFILSFGLAFELPLAVLVLVKLGIVTAEMMRRTRAFALVIIFVFAAVITPTSDLLTLMLMGGPMYVLYEICILIAWLMERKERRQSEKLMRG